MRLENKIGNSYFKDKNILKVRTTNHRFVYQENQTRILLIMKRNKLFIELSFVARVTIRLMILLGQQGIILQSLKELRVLFLWINLT